MNVGSAEYQAWQSACDAEREAWRFARCRLPGAPEYDREAWVRWQAALHEADEALRACLLATSRRVPRRTGGRHFTRP